jgi:hypothetical protein
MGLLKEICSIATRNPTYWGRFSLSKATQGFRVVAAVFNMTLKGLAHLCRDITGRRCKGQAVYALVHFFIGALQSLHNLCQVQVSQRQELQTTIHQDRSYTYGDLEVAARVNTIITKFSEMLYSILTAPEFQRSNTYYSEVIEGLYSGLLDRIGGLVSQAVFEENLATSVRPGCISRSDLNNIPKDTKQNLVVQLEGQSLAYVLKLVISGRGDSKPEDFDSVLCRILDSKTNSRNEVLLTKARSSLQKTLLKGTFGEEGERFKEALRLPEASAEHHEHVTATQYPDHVHDFVETVWSIVGWETMSS